MNRGADTVDVAVIGAGPAGAMAAREAARRGASVLLVDKARFPRAKVCGCCVNGRGLAVLERVGLGELCDQLRAQPLRELHLAAGGRTARIPIPKGVAVSRAALDAALAAAAAAEGAMFLDGTSAALAARGPRVHRISLRRDGETWTVEARVVLVADGLGGTFLREVSGFTCETRPGTRMGAGAVGRFLPGAGAGAEGDGVISMACGAGGYVGQVRLEDGELDVAAAFDLDFVRAAGGPASAAATILQDAGLPGGEMMARLVWRGTPGLTRRRQPVADERIFVLGDAAGYIEPFTGEGIAWALASGEAVADLAVQAARRWEPGLAQAWAQRHWRVAGWGHRRCRCVASALRRPGLTRGGVRALAAMPWLARPMVERMTAASTEWGMAR